MGKCQYVIGYNNGLRRCEAETAGKLFDPMVGREIFICEPHQVFSKPLSEWTEEDYKLTEKY